MSRFAGKVAVITGGGTGIGRATALVLAREGADVVVVSNVAEQAEAVAAEVRALGRKGLARVVDVTDIPAVNALAADVDAEFGKTDILVTCAGVMGARKLLTETTSEEWGKTIEVNLNGTMRMCLAARDKLATKGAGKAGGAIVNIASMLTFHGSPFAPGYAASKGGVGQLTKSLAAAWATDGIRVNAVAPGWIATELTRPLVEDAERSAPILARTPMNRWGEPADIGGAIVFLLSDAARFVTGTVLPVDGGYLAV